MALNGGVSFFFNDPATTEIYTTSSFECKACPNRCEIVQMRVGRKVVARWGGRCDRWDVMPDRSPATESACETCDPLTP